VGWMSAFNTNRIIGNNYIDFAGCGVVHMVGGISGTVGAIIVGPRKGRWDPRARTSFRPINESLVALGAMCLWFGWYGFNPGSILLSNGGSHVASISATNTTISAASGGLVCLVQSKLFLKSWRLFISLNGILAGLVSITSSTSVIEPWAACIVGFVGGIIYFWVAFLTQKIRVDDPLDVTAVHFCCGVWGLIAVGLFAESQHIDAVYPPNPNGKLYSGLFITGQPEQLAAQLLGITVIFCWTACCSTILFSVLRFFGILRIAHENELKSLEMPLEDVVANNAKEEPHAAGVTESNVVFINEDEDDSTEELLF